VVPTRGGHSIGDTPGARSEDSALLSCREVEGRHHCHAAGCAPWHGRPGALPGRAAEGRAPAPRVADRSLPALCSPDPGEVPETYCQPPLCDGVRARLQRRGGSLPPSDCPPPAPSAARGLSASEDTAGRTGPSGLGTLWKAHHRQGRTHLDGLRDGAELLAGDLSALLPRCADGQLPAWPPGRLHGLGWTTPGLALRQPQKCRARAPGRCHPLPSHAAGIRRPLSLRTAPGGGGAGQ